MKDLSIPVVVTLATVGVFLGVHWFTRSLEAERRNRLADPGDKRFRELLALSSSPQFELNVSGSSQILLAVLVVLTGATLLFLAASGEEGVWAVLGGGASLVMGLLAFLGSAPTLGRPKISVTLHGFRTPLTPFIPWKLVRGIYLQEVTYRDRRGGQYFVAHDLQFFIPSLPLLISWCGLFLRLANILRTGSQTLHVVLKSTSESPEVLYRLIRELWTADTGRNHLWIPGMSPAFNDAMRRMDEAEARFLREALAGPNASKPGSDEEIAKTFSESAAVVEAEMDSRTRKLNWWAVAVTAAMMLWLAVLYLRV